VKLLSRSVISCLIGLAAIVSSGCTGKGLHAVSGVVTMDGEPYADANVLFTPVGEGGLSATGETDASGHFTMHTRGTENGVLPGKYKVSVTPIDRDYVRQGHPSEAFSKRAQEGKTVKGGGADYAKMQAEVTKSVKERAKQRPIPLQYTDPTKTPLPTVQVPDQSDVKIELSSK